LAGCYDVHLFHWFCRPHTSRALVLYSSVRPGVGPAFGSRLSGHPNGSSSGTVRKCTRQKPCRAHLLTSLTGRQLRSRHRTYGHVCLPPPRPCKLGSVYCSILLIEPIISLRYALKSLGISDTPRNTCF